MARKITLAFNPAALKAAAGVSTAGAVDNGRPLISGTELHYANKLGVAASSALINLLKGGPSY